jgi:hypothetical protein
MAGKRRVLQCFIIADGEESSIGVCFKNENHGASLKLFGLSVILFGNKI